MKGAKELADTLREFCVIESEDDGVAIIAHLDAKAAIDSAVLGEVETIKSRFDGGTAGDNTLQAVHDIKELLAIVQHQASDLTTANASILKLRAEVEEQKGENDAVRAAWEAEHSMGGTEPEAALTCMLQALNTIRNQKQGMNDGFRTLISERDAARAEVETLRKNRDALAHGEAEALKMMGAERQRADRLAAELATAKERAAKDDAGVMIHACPPKGSGIMPCCGRTPFEVMGDRMSTKPEVVNCDRAILHIVAEHEREQAAPVVDMTPGGSCPDFRPQQLADLSARDHEQVNRHAKDIGCRAGTDDDCYWSDCPQIGDGEPRKSGRSCPLWDTSDREV